MKGLFNYDGGVMSFLGKVADLVLLNIIMLIFSIPIITIGAVQTAGHYTALKLKREEGHVFSNFWKSFKMNFGQATLIWLIIIIEYALNILALLISFNSGMKMSSLVCGVLFAALIFITVMNLWVYPIQARFVNKISGTFKNAFFMGLRYFLRSIYMIICYALPIVLFMVSPRLFPLLLLLGTSTPIYLSVLAYNKLFEKLEEQILGKNDEEKEEAEENENDSEDQLQLPGGES